MLRFRFSGTGSVSSVDMAAAFTASCGRGCVNVGEAGVSLIGCAFWREMLFPIAGEVFPFSIPCFCEFFLSLNTLSDRTTDDAPPLPPLLYPNHDILYHFDVLIQRHQLPVKTPLSLQWNCQHLDFLTPSLIFSKMVHSHFTFKRKHLLWTCLRKTGRNLWSVTIDYFSFACRICFSTVVALILIRSPFFLVILSTTLHF